MTTEIRPLNAQEKATQKDVLGKAAKLVGAKTPLTETNVQALYDKLRQHHDQADHVNGLGVAFGELIVKNSNFGWAHVKYDGGYEACVGAPKSTIFCTPLSMMTKRIARGEATNIAKLCRDTIEAMEQRLTQGTRN